MELLEAEKRFVLGIDFSPEVNLSDGYVSVWEKENGNEVMVYSFHCPDTNRFLYDIIPKQTWDDIKMDYLEDILSDPEDYQGLLSFTGQTIKHIDYLYQYGKELDEINEEIEALNIIDEFQSYYGSPFSRFKSVKTLEELLDIIVK